MYSHRETGLTAKGIYRFLEAIVGEEHIGAYVVAQDSLFSRSGCDYIIAKTSGTEVRGSGLLAKMASIQEEKHDITSVDLYLLAPQDYYSQYGVSRKEVKDHGAPTIHIRIDYMNGKNKGTYSISIQTGLGREQPEKINDHNMSRIVSAHLGKPIKALKKKI